MNTTAVGRAGFPVLDHNAPDLMQGLDQHLDHSLRIVAARSVTAPDPGQTSLRLCSNSIDNCASVRIREREVNGPHEREWAQFCAESAVCH
jgi:hypothetical protein